MLGPPQWTHNPLPFSTSLHMGAPFHLYYMLLKTGDAKFYLQLLFKSLQFVCK